MNQSDTNPTESRTGLPTKRTPANAKILCDAIGRGIPFVHACAVARLSYQTFCVWRNEDPEFKEAIETALADGVSKRLKIIEDASSADWRASAWLLEHCQPEHFAKSRVQMEHVGKVSHEFAVPQDVIDSVAEARKKHDQQTQPG